jgi:hypothetical protein
MRTNGKDSAVKYCLCNRLLSETLPERKQVIVRIE